jgi:hypothetical protein
MSCRRCARSNGLAGWPNRGQTDVFSSYFPIQEKVPLSPCFMTAFSEPRNCSVRLRHFEHRMAEFLMQKLTANLPALAFIEVNRANV